jgi:predicted nucleic acid-binding protein
VKLRRSINADEPIVVTEPVVMEVLAGAASERHAQELRSALLVFPLVAVAGLDDYEEAAAIQRACRAQGLTIRNTIDCLIAAVAMRVGASILHKDRDFDAIARCTDLKIQPVSPSPS